MSCHGVDGFFGQAGLAGHLAQGFRADIRNAYVAQAHGQTHRGAEAQHFVQFFRGGVFQHQLHQRAKGDLFAVQIGVGFFQRGQAIVDGMLKRFTALCHFWLGATLGLAPLAGWLSVNPASLGLAPVLLFWAVTFWVAAFDIYYAFQDMDFDVAFELHSVPASFGPDTALTLAAFSHAMTSIFLLLAGFAAGLSWPWYVVWFGISVMLLVEHRLMKPQDLRHVNTAFFTINGIISPVVLAGVLLSIYI